MSDTSQATGSRQRPRTRKRVRLVVLVSIVLCLLIAIKLTRPESEAPHDSHAFFRTVEGLIADEHFYAATRFVKKTDAFRQAAEDFADGRFVVIGVYGDGKWYPGLEAGRFRKHFDRYNHDWTFPGTSDVIREPWQGTAESFAEQYNRVMFRLMDRAMQLNESIERQTVK